ncbi:uncharacterized protein LOC129753772 [Uranotaenia lowii]|uniref:uncharacterized protein LOC129753772 n=1 Tax=Uranotaenia lowii TaxID=190385 RepID=UPI002478DBAA|nr:uncharacterized protein LOC129753772 [Uranotaenia lowii]
MPISNATTDSVELEILEIRQDSSDDEEGLAIGGAVAKPCSPPRRKRFRRNRTNRRKSNSQSCGSLYNLASIRPLYPQRSEPNVNYFASGEQEGIIDINFHVEDSSNTLDDAPVLESCESIGDAMRTRNSTGIGTGSFCGASCGGGGGVGYFSSGAGGDGTCGSIGAGSGSGGSHGQYGIKASIVTMLEKLGMWNQNGKVVKSQIHKSDTKSSFDRGQSYISNGATRLRSIFGGSGGPVTGKLAWFSSSTLASWQHFASHIGESQRKSPQGAQLLGKPSRLLIKMTATSSRSLVKRDQDQSASA